MRIEGFVPVLKSRAQKKDRPFWKEKDRPFWKEMGATEKEVWEGLAASYGDVEHAKEDGWTVVRVGDVDSIRDEAIEEVAVKKERDCAFTGEDGEKPCDACRHEADEIRAMKAIRAARGAA